MAKKRKGSETTIKVTDGGSLKKVGKEAEKASGKFNQFDKSAHSADRAGRGVAQMSSNSTKNFSKLSQGISGGLVPAYATLAAQLFALDALFRFLKDSADFRVLKEGQEAFAASTGTAYKTLSREIQAATDAQVTFAESSQAAAIGMAAGLSPAQLIELSEAAKTVSIALGRDTTDSFNRLVRGVTKAEPELLDELGIVLRLEEASIRYAAALGLNKNELTVFQKSQAVTNEVLRQAEEKFGAMNDVQETTTNQIAKMAIAFDEVLNNIKTVIGPIAEFFGTFIANNLRGATMAIGVFAATMLKKLIPAFKQVDAASLGKGMSARMAGDTDTGGMFGPGKTKASQDRYDRMQAGTMDKKDITAYQKSLKVKQSSFVNYNKFTKATQKKTYYELEAMQKMHLANENVGFKRSWHNWKANLNLMKAEYGTFVGTIKAYSQGLATAINTALGIIGWIGIAIMAAQMAWDKWGHLIREVNPHLEEFKKRTEEATAKVKSLNDELKKIVDVTKKGIIKDWEANVVRTGNALNSMNVTGQMDTFNELAALKFYDKEAWTQYQTEFETFLHNMTIIQPALKKYMNLYYEGSLTAVMQKQLKEDVQLFVSAGQAQQEYARGASKLVKEQNKLVQALPKIKYQDYAQTLVEMVRAQDQVADSITKQIERATEQGDAVEQLNAQYDELMSRMFFHKTELNLINEIQKEDIRLQKEKIALSQSTIFKQFVGTEAQDRMLTLEKQRQVVQKHMFTLQKGRARLEVLVATASKGQKENLKQQLKIQEEMLVLEMARLRAIEMQTDAVFKTYNTIFKNFQKDMGSAIGASLRGDDAGWDKLRENMRKTITDAIGESITNQMMNKFLGPILPRTIAQKIGDAHQHGADDIQSSIKKGATAFASEWETGGRIKYAMDSFITNLSIAMGTYKEGMAMDLLSRNKRMAMDLEVAERAVGKKVDGEWVGGPGVKTDKDGQVTDQYKAWEERMRKMNPLELWASTLEGEAEIDWRKQMGEQPRAYDTANAIRAALTDKKAGIEASGEFKQYSSPAGAWKNLDFTDIAETVGKTDERFKAYFQEALQDDDLVSFDELQKILKEVDRKGGVYSVGPRGNPWDTGRSDIGWSSDKNFARQEQKSGLEVSAEQIDQAIQKKYKGDAFRQDEAAKLEDLKISNEALTTENINQIAALNLTAERLNELETTISGITDPAQLDKIIGETVESTASAEDIVGGGGKDDPTTSDPEKYADNKWVQGTQDFLGGAAMILGAAGQGEKASRMMKIAATIMMTVAIMDRARAALEAGGGFWKVLGNFITGTPGGRYGGVMNFPGYRSFGTGGISQGPNSGYGAILHGTEAVVPLGNDKAIPVHMSGGGSVNNTSVTVNMDSGTSDTVSDAEQGRQLGHLIQSTVTETISREQRSGGLLDVGG